MASAVRARWPFGCGGTGDFHDDCAATAWCYHVKKNQKLWEMFPAFCWISDPKDWDSWDKRYQQGPVSACCNLWINPNLYLSKHKVCPCFSSVFSMFEKSSLHCPISLKAKSPPQNIYLKKWTIYASKLKKFSAHCKTAMPNSGLWSFCTPDSPSNPLLLSCSHPVMIKLQYWH